MALDDTSGIRLARCAGRGPLAAERVIGFDSQFYAPADLRERVAASGFAASVPEREFGHTAAGVKPS